MTLRGLPPTSGEQSVPDLREEGIRRDPEPQDRESKHLALAKRHGVLTKCVADHRGRSQMMDSVDLDNEVEGGPLHVEVRLAVGRPTNDLAIRLRQAIAPAQPGEVELAHRLCA